MAEEQVTLLVCGECHESKVMAAFQKDENGVIGLVLTCAQCGHQVMKVEKI